MPAKSEKQRKFMAVVRAYKRGKVKGKVSKSVRDAAKSMSDKEVSDFMKKDASGKMLRKALEKVGPEHISGIDVRILKELGLPSTEPTGNMLISALMKRYRGWQGSPTTQAKAIFAPTAKREKVMKRLYHGSDKMVELASPAVEKDRKMLAELGGLTRSKLIKSSAFRRGFMEKMANRLLQSTGKAVAGLTDDALKAGLDDILTTWADKGDNLALDRLRRLVAQSGGADDALAGLRNQLDDQTLKALQLQDDLAKQQAQAAKVRMELEASNRAKGMSDLRADDLEQALKTSTRATEDMTARHADAVDRLLNTTSELGDVRGSLNRYKYWAPRAAMLTGGAGLVTGAGAKPTYDLVSGWSEDKTASAREMVKEAININRVHKAMANRALKTKLWAAIGGLRGITDPDELLKFVNDRARKPLSMRSVLRRPVDTTSNFLRGAFGNVEAAGGPLTKDQFRDNFVRLMNRTADDSGNLMLRPEKEWVTSAGKPNTFNLGDTGFKAAISGNELNPMVPMWDALYRGDIDKNLFKSLYNQDVAKALKSGLGDEFLVKLHKAGINPENVDPKQLRQMAAAHLKQNVKSKGLGGASERLNQTMALVPEWSGLANLPGHAEVLGLYGSMGFAPARAHGMAMMYRPGGALRKDSVQRFKDLIGSDPGRIVVDARVVNRRKGVDQLLDDIASKRNLAYADDPAVKALGGGDDEALWVNFMRDRLQGADPLRKSVAGLDLDPLRQSQNRLAKAMESLESRKLPMDKFTRNLDPAADVFDRVGRMAARMPERIRPQVPSFA
jgi:hypothetical protein